ncbi:MAG: TRAP transporter TatT component family protein [Acidobacteriota bacterium]|nr:TRAP transporter TatT component family protein [Acidobacteriota bacterium]
MRAFHPLVLAAFLVLSGCSVKRMAAGAIGGVFADAESVFLTDEDPDLVGEALPFSLKIIETMLSSSPDDESLLLSGTTVCTLYTYGFVEPKAWPLENEDFEAAEAVRARASKLYQRAWGFAVRGMETRHVGLGERLRRDPVTAAAELKPADIHLAVWGASALGAAIGMAPDNPELTADIALVGALLERALELDPTYREGVIQELLIAYETARFGGDVEKARVYYDQAMNLSKGASCPAMVTWAESACVRQQNRKEFEQILGRVRSFDVDAVPERRLLNVLAQRRAEWLLSRVDELFLE